MTLRRSLAAAALALAALTLPASATSLTADGRIAADCSGFTLTFFGTGFEPDPQFDEVFIEWTVFLDRDGVRTPFDGSLALTFADGGATPEKSLFVPWDVDVCGTNAIVSGGEFPAGYSWSNETGDGSRGAFLFNYDDVYGPAGASPVVTALLNCPCGGPDPVCRPPAFWGTYAGREFRCSNNLTQSVLDAVGGIEVCGRELTKTSLRSGGSALEALCVSPFAPAKLQLARQLTAAALNCEFSGAPGCAGLPIGPTFAACNDACAGLGEAAIDSCIDALACFNKGGTRLANGMCQTGTCNGDGVTPCDGDRACHTDRDGCGHGHGGKGGRCVPTPGNCLHRPLVSDALDLDFDPPGFPGSIFGCLEATKTRCTIFGCN